LTSTNHKDIRTLYIFFGLFFGLVGSSLSRLIRYELMSPGTNFLSNHSYNLIVTGHRVIMVFFFIIPFLIRRFRNWLIPLFAGAADISFPRINNLSFWLLLPASFLLIESTLVRGARSRWTIYPPLSSRERAIDYVILSLHCARVSSILRSANFLVTMLFNSYKTGSVYTIRLFLWCILVTAFILLTTLPVLARCITIILFDRHLNTSYFDSRGRGDAVLFQHLFWFFRHPEVYVLILPGFRMLSHTIEFHCNGELLRYVRIVWSIISIGFLGFVVWAHHIYSVRIDTDSKVYFSTATIIIRIPTRVKIFTWIYNTLLNSLFFTSSLLWVILFIWLFTIRRVTRIVLSNASVDLILHDTYYVVAHFHYVLSIGATSAVIIGSLFYWPIFTRVSTSEWAVICSSLLFCVGVNRVFFPMHSLGVERMPRRYVNYSFLITSGNKVIRFNLIVTIVSTIILLSLLKPTIRNLSIFSSLKLTSETVFRCNSKWHSFEERGLVL